MLISIRDFEPDKGDIILKYTNDEYKDMTKSGELPESFKVEEVGEQDSDDEVEFHDSSNKTSGNTHYNHLYSQAKFGRI